MRLRGAVGATKHTSAARGIKRGVLQGWQRYSPRTPLLSRSYKAHTFSARTHLGTDVSLCWSKGDSAVMWIALSQITDKQPVHRLHYATPSVSCLCTKGRVSLSVRLHLTVEPLPRCLHIYAQHTHAHEVKIMLHYISLMDSGLQKSLDRLPV